MMKRKAPAAGTSSGGKDLEEEVERSFKKGKCSGGKVKKGSFEHRFERRRYLNQLANEFDTTTVMECKQQVLANLANFAYDPYNYHFFQEIGVIPRFLAELSVDRNEKLTEFAMAGVCNCSPDRRIQKELLRKDGLAIVKRHVYSLSASTVLSAVTTLINFLSCGDKVGIKEHILADDFRLRLDYLLAHEADKRVQNVVQVLIDELQ